jgi:hypothetical protein
MKILPVQFTCTGSPEPLSGADIITASIITPNSPINKGLHIFLYNDLELNKNRRGPPGARFSPV